MARGSSDELYTVKALFILLPYVSLMLVKTVPFGSAGLDLPSASQKRSETGGVYVTFEACFESRFNWILVHQYDLLLEALLKPRFADLAVAHDGGDIGSPNRRISVVTQMSACYVCFDGLFIA